MFTPVDIETKVFSRVWRGYNPADVQEFMNNLAKDYEHLYRENLDLKEEIEEQKVRLAQYQSIDETLRNTMITAQETAEEVKNNARTEASLIIREAENKAHEISANIKEEIQNELRNLAVLKNQGEFFKCQFKSFLNGLMELVDKQMDLNVVWDKPNNESKKG